MTLRARMRQLSGQSLIYGLSGALTKLVALVVVPILGHIFLPGDYSVIDYVSSFSSLVGSILILGSDAAVGYYFYREADEDGQRTLLSTWLIFQFALNTIVGVVLFVLAGPLTNLLLGATHSSLYLQIVAIVLPLSTTIGYALEVMRLQLRPYRYLVISAVSTLSGFALTAILLLPLHLGLRGVYIASAGTNVITFAMAMWYMRGNVGWRFSSTRLRAVLAYGLPLMPISIATWAISLSNRFFIRAHSGAADEGLFAMGNRVAQIMFLAVTAFTLAWGPFSFSIAKDGDARRTYAKVLTFYMAVMGWIALGLSLFAPLILQVAVSAHFARAYQVVAPLSLGYVVGGAYSIVAIGTSLSRKTIHISWTTIVAAAVTVALNVVLLPLPYLSLAGGALAFLGGNIVSVGLVYLVSQRLYPVPYERGRVLGCVGVLTVLVVGGQVERIWTEPNLAVGLAIRLALLALYPLALIGLGVIQRYEVVVLRNGLRAQLWGRGTA